MRIFIERNLVHIESLGLLALTRYIFELSVWISLLEQSASFGLVYRVRQLENNQKFYSDLKNHLLLEAKCFKQIDSEKNSQIEKLARNAANSPEPEELAAAIHSIEDAIDNRMALSFSIYGDEAKKNGYGFQAHLIEQKAITHAETKLAAIERELQEYRNTWADTLKEIYPPNSKGEGRWKWKEQARRTNMLDEFNFIYSYTSRLLHAEPIGLTTDEKSLTYKEIILFARYISSKINECMGKATQLINASTLH